MYCSGVGLELCTVVTGIGQCNVVEWDWASVL